MAAPRNRDLVVPLAVMAGGVAIVAYAELELPITILASAMVVVLVSLVSWPRVLVAMVFSGGAITGLFSAGVVLGVGAGKSMPEDPRAWRAVIGVVVTVALASVVRMADRRESYDMVRRLFENTCARVDVPWLPDVLALVAIVGLAQGWILGVSGPTGLADNVMAGRYGAAAGQLVSHVAAIALVWRLMGWRSG